MATLRCEECGYKLYEDEDECPKCGAAVDERPRSKKKSRDDDDRPVRKPRRDEDDDRRPAKKANSDFDVVDDEAEPRSKKKTAAKKSPSSDFEIDDEENADDRPARKTLPPKNPSLTDAPQTAKNAARTGDDAPISNKKKTKGKFTDLVVPRWTGVFLWTIILGFIGPLMLSGGIYLVMNSGIGKERRNEYILGVAIERIEYRERDTTKDTLGFGLAVVGGSAVVMSQLLFNLWLYRGWKLIPKQYGGMNPWVAILLLWLPLVNLVGMFLVIPGLSKAMLRMLAELEPDRTTKTGAGIGMVACIFLFIPLLNILSPLMFLAWFDQANYAKNRIDTIQEAARLS